MWSIGKVHGRSKDGCSYQIITENGSLVSRNRVHIRLTGTEYQKCVFVEKSLAEPVTDACASQIKMMPSEPVPTKPPSTTIPHSNATKSSIVTNADGYRMCSGRIVRKPPRYHD